MTRGISQNSQGFREYDLTRTYPDAPRWPSGIDSVDDRAGGFYCLSLVAGFEKLGKTLLAVRSSAEAATSGWFVLYLLTENHERVVQRQLVNVFGAAPANWPTAFWENWHALRFDDETPDTLVQRICGYLVRAESKELRLLLVLDHINAWADSLSRNPTFLPKVRGQRYFAALNFILRAFTRMVDYSNGDIGVLAISEVNRAGQVKGQSGQYLFSGVLLNIKGAGKQHHVEIDMVSRETPGGELGEHIRVFSRCQFMAADDYRPVAIQGGRDA